MFLLRPFRYRFVGRQSPRRYRKKAFYCQEMIKEMISNATQLFRQYQFNESILLMEKTVETLKQQPNNEKNMILPLMNLSDFYFSVNNFKGASSALQNVLNCIDVAIDPKDKSEHGPTNSFIALLISDLALANEYGGNIQEAQVFYNRSLNIIKSM